MKSIKVFPTLYNTTIGTGRKKQWSIQVFDNGDNTFTVRSTHGIVSGKQVDHDTVVCEGKNIGKKNETTPMEQAILEAEREWTKKSKQGYNELTKLVNEVMDAGEKENVVKGGADKKIVLKPMLALEFDPLSDTKYPVYIQPKLDGVRCLVYYSGTGDILFQSRQNTLFDRFDHLVDEIGILMKTLGNPQDFVLDGELYIHGAEFNEITSIVRRSKTKHPNTANLKYHIYDCFYFGEDNLDKNKMPYSARNKLITEAFKKHTFKHLVLVETRQAGSMDEVEELHGHFTTLEKPYEGVMIRTIGGVYKQQGRSKDLQKYKKFCDEEFEVVGYHEGTGAHAGTPIFDCRSKKNPEKTFGVTMNGPIEARKDMLKNVKKYIGQQLTVKYQELTPDGIPRFPVGIAFRNYE
jgi:DNA ligase-1